ncbi:MAG: UTP--glucose-1-phosphate uridylyltransferase GalU [Oscillospiraceae bacterium]|nr:UTP--glucose-1-phosphate uridylyltransferase GalU [Oscillospiraceae bacterium]
MKITKAVIPAAGLGTRMLPAAKAVPKEMMPIVDEPAIQYLVEEAVKSGITDILIITNRDKDAIEDYFDYSPEYETRLTASGKTEMLERIRRVANLANIQFVRQKQAKGLGHAVRCAKSFVGNEPFAVMYGDDIIDAAKPTVGEMIKLYEKYELPVLGVQTVSREQIKKYCTLDAAKLADRVYKVKDMIEKPTEEQIITQLAILGRVLLTPDIFDIIDHTLPGAGGEIQLTDAMAEIARARGMIAYEFDGVRHDMGSKLGFLIANVSMGVKNPEIGSDFKKWLKEFASEL